MAPEDTLQQMSGALLLGLVLLQGAQLPVLVLLVLTLVLVLLSAVLQVVLQVVL